MRYHVHIEFPDPDENQVKATFSITAESFQEAVGVMIGLLDEEHFELTEVEEVA